MRSVLLATSLVIASCSEPSRAPVDAGAEESPDARAGVGPTEPPAAPREGHLYLATMPSGAVHVVRVEADGATSVWGPPVTSNVGRMLQSTDGRRVLVQDHTAGTTHALHGERWVSICPGLDAQRCFARAPRSDLGVFVAQRAWDDPSGIAAALLSYAGERLAPSDGRWGVHSDLGWSLVSDGSATFVRGSDGRVTELAMLEGEVPMLALGANLVSHANDYTRAWLRDLASGARTELVCPDGRSAREIAGVGARLVCCDGAVHRLAETGLEPTAHRCDGAPLEHLEDGSYTVTRAEVGRTSALSFVAPDGRPLAVLTRDYPAPGAPFPDSYARVTLVATRAEPDRFVAYVVLVHLGIAHDDVELAREEGVLVWRRDGAIDWHPVDAASEGAAYRVWIPSSAERAFWVTPDGRLVSFELDSRALVDRSAELRFRPGIDGG